MYKIYALSSAGKRMTELVQWDQDVLVLIKDKNIDKPYNVHFANENSDEAYVVESTYENGVLKAKIPNILLTDCSPISGYIYIDTPDKEFKSIYGFDITVLKRSKPATYVYKGEQDYLSAEKILDESAIHAKEAKSFACGGTGLRPDEDTDNAKFYFEQSKNAIIHAPKIENGLWYVFDYDTQNYVCTGERSEGDYKGAHVIKESWLKSLGDRGEITPEILALIDAFDQSKTVVIETDNNEDGMCIAVGTEITKDPKYKRITYRFRYYTKVLDEDDAVYAVNYTISVSLSGNKYTSLSSHGKRGYGAHVEGGFTSAPGNTAHVEGYNSKANGDNSHAEGRMTKTEGFCSHVEGEETVALADHQHVQGKYNKPDTNKEYAHIVGGGAYLAPRNIHTLDWEGNSWYSGDVLVGGSGMDSSATISLRKIASKITDNSIILKSSTYNSNKKFEITVDDTGTIKAEEVI